MCLDWFIDKLVKFCGWVFITIVLFILTLSAIVNIQSMMTEQHLNEGYVASKGYDEGNYYYSTWQFGDYSFSKRKGGIEKYIIEVVDDRNNRDFWWVTEDIWNSVTYGDYVRK